MKFIFFGTPEFAAIVLEKLISFGYMPAAVVCNPDEPVGRKQILTFPPMKVLAQKHNISIFQPAKLRSNKEFMEQFKNINPDLAIIAAYGKILPKEILDIPRLGFINVHGSLLPYYRGASPIQDAILNGDRETGITIMEIDEKMDRGKIISNLKTKISKSDTYETLSKKLAELGAELLIKTIPDYISGKVKPQEQDHSKATYTKIIKKEDGKIDWSKSAGEIERMTRAFYPWPSAYTYVNLKYQISSIKIIESEVSENKNNYQIGEVFALQHPYKLENVGVLLAVKCGSGNLIIKKLQLKGGRVLTTEEFLNGHKNFIGSILK